MYILIVFYKNVNEKLSRKEVVSEKTKGIANNRKFGFIYYQLFTPPI